jgi:exopolysaccharide biosynthesis polyprenyl glycosylphosphotransferase
VSKRVQAAKYIFFDFVGSAIAWVVFNIYRKKVVESQLFGVDLTFTPDLKFYLGIIVFPIFWTSLFGLAGFYHDVLRKSRLNELSASIGYTLLGCLLIFFAMLLDDYVVSYKSYYLILLSLFSLIFLLTYFPRLIITTQTIHKVHSRKIGFPSIIIGSGEKAVKLFNELEAEKMSQGYKLLGYVKINPKDKDHLNEKLPCLGPLESLGDMVKKMDIEEVILATEKENPETLTRVINELLSLNVIIKAIPSMYDHLSGRVKMTGILSAPLLNISFELMPPWQANLKQVIDYTMGTIAFIVLIPLIIALALIIKLSSKGPIFYRQERIGQFGKPFTLLKFRSMYSDAEVQGPALSSKNDPRVTPVGRFMRKTRLDELPNFLNVIKGDMSLVGPRPERQYFIDQILKVAPHYIHLQKVKPGITSWGQVKYGYAESVEQMVERLKYDLLYLENMSLIVDFKIIIYTLITVIRGRGV